MIKGIWKTGSKYISKKLYNNYNRNINILIYFSFKNNFFRIIFLINTTNTLKQYKNNNFSNINWSNF